VGAVGGLVTLGHGDLGFELAGLVEPGLRAPGLAGGGESGGIAPLEEGEQAAA